MATKTTKVQELDHPGLTELIGNLQSRRQLKKVAGEMEKEASEGAKELLEEFGLGKFSVRPGLTFAYREAKRSSISKDLLLEAGVDPGIVEKCMVETKYRYIGEIKSQ